MTTRTIHPFPARMAPEIALNAIPQKGMSELTVLDPMCGSGTVLTAAMERGHVAIGVDIDPLAVMMSQVAVNPVDVERLIAESDRVAHYSLGIEGIRPWGDDKETGQFVDFWFGKEQRDRLAALVTAVDTADDPAIRLALRVAVSRTIVTKSPQASLAADTAHSRPHKVASTSTFDVVAGFLKSVKQLSRMLAARSRLGRAHVSLGDARTLYGIRDGSVDLAVTSPPYLNALDYLRGHKLALVWFGHTIADLRTRRSVSIGSERALESRAVGCVDDMVQLIEDDAIDKSLLRRGMIERFAQDCIDFGAELSRVVRPGGRAVLVVGNSTLRGNYIRNDALAEIAMTKAGFSLCDRYEREIPPTKRYMAIDAKAASSIAKRMRTEVVLTMER